MEAQAKAYMEDLQEKAAQDMKRINESLEKENAELKTQVETYSTGCVALEKELKELRDAQKLAESENASKADNGQAQIDFEKKMEEALKQQ